MLGSQGGAPRLIRPPRDQAAIAGLVILVLAACSSSTPSPIAEAPRVVSIEIARDPSPSPIELLSPTAPLVTQGPTPAPTRRPDPTRPPTPVPKPRPLRVVHGTATTYGPGWDGWIAWPAGPGWRLRICGAGGCALRTSNDAGPSKAGQRAGRVVDLDVATFELVCGKPWRAGVCTVRVEVLGR